jgi:hypothetical protein
MGYYAGFVNKKLKLFPAAISLHRPAQLRVKAELNCAGTAVDHQGLAGNKIGCFRA